MKKELGKKQSFARELNNKIVIEEIERHPNSGCELAAKLKLSNATISSILSSLLRIGLIKIYSTDSVNGLGRKRVVYSLNDKYCLVLVVSITSFSISLRICNFTGQILCEKDRNIEKYDLKTIYETIIHIKDMLSREDIRDIPLKDIIISLPGLINKNSGDLQVSPQFDKTLFDNEHTISKLFKESFDCDVYLENDTKLMMLGELSKGTFPQNSKGMLIYCDLGIGGALEFDNKIFLGSRGYAGEIGLLRVKYKDEIKPLDEFISLRAFKDTINEKYHLNLTIDEIITLYKNGDERIINEVKIAAEILSFAIIDIVNIIDLDYFVLSGRITEFGDLFINEVRTLVNAKHKDVVIEYSYNDLKAIIDGAKKIGIEYVLKTSLENLKKEEN